MSAVMVQHVDWNLQSLQATAKPCHDGRPQQMDLTTAALEIEMNEMHLLQMAEHISCACDVTL
jgi:hypothetical protein